METGITYWEISYRRTYYWIDKKYVKSELGSTDAIRKTKVKNITDCVQITKEEYESAKARQKELKDKRKDNFII